MIYLEILGKHINRADKMESLILPMLWRRKSIHIDQHYNFNNVETIKTQGTQRQQKAPHSRKGSANKEQA